MRYLLSVILFSLLCIQSYGQFLIGSGIADVTGQIAEVGFMGYAAVGQTGSGVHLRSYARAFVVVDPDTQIRSVYVSTDLCMGFQMIKLGVIEALQKKFNDLYVFDNVIIGGTHTHSSPGGLGGTALVDITTLGFVHENYEAAVNGIVDAITQAHNNLKPGSILFNEGELDGASINRSPASYQRNPDAEKSQYSTDTDKLMTILKFVLDDGTEIGMINFYAVHAVSMNNTNTLVSSDNKGAASIFFEQDMNPAGTLPGKGPFVAAFGNSNEGDVSPNILGPTCEDGITPCDFVHSSCGGRSQGCTAKGPGKDMFESTEIIARLQYQKAKDLYSSASTHLKGGVGFKHQYIEIQNIVVSPNYTSTGKQERTCIPAFGYAFAAGTIDGPGDFDFVQGTNSTNPFWAWVTSFLAAPTADQIACQAPKPILIDVGLIQPIEWVPYIVPIQLIRFGNFYIASVPGEFTTMSGRRLRNTIKQALIDSGVWTDDSRVVISGLSNSYTHYITTFEEYQEQRYEGASTLYGPHTLAAYQQQFYQLTLDLVHDIAPPAGPVPIDMRNHTFSFLPAVVEDSTPSGTTFGSVQSDAVGPFKPEMMASATFWGANPRNNLRTSQSFCDVEVFVNNEWVVIASDSNWETRYHWKRVEIDQSLVTCEWYIPSNTPSGSYRFHTYGTWKKIDGTLTDYQGVSSAFQVVMS